MLHRFDPGRAHRRLVEHEEQWSRAMEADHQAQLRMAANDPGSDRLCLADLAEANPDLKRALSDYREVVRAHSRAVEAAWAEHHHLLERASCAGLRAAAAAHNGRPTWQGLGVLQRSAPVIDARRRPPRSVRPRTARTSPRIRRAAARRAAGPRSGADPGGDGESHSFGRFLREQADLSPAGRLAVFAALPADVQSLYWEALAAELDGGAR